MNFEPKVFLPKELLRKLTDPLSREELSPPHGTQFVLVDLSQDQLAIPNQLLPVCPVIGLHKAKDKIRDDSVDCYATKNDLSQILASISSRPIPSAILVHVLRQSLHNDIPSALVLESIAYGSLQKSSDFQKWLSERDEIVPQISNSDCVISSRSHEQLTIQLNRPEKHNAFNQAMRDQLCEILQLPLIDLSLTSVNVVGAGKSFCSGGDLDEFGLVGDAGAAHLVRTSRSPAQLFNLLAPKMTAMVHGACIGAGIELAAFCKKIIAKEDAFFQLPEIGLGLLPGAGGTASLPRRIGRYDTALLAITGKTINSDEALELGLIDEIRSD